MEIQTAQEQQLFNGKDFHVFICHKSESVSGLHQHDYYEFTIVLTGRYYQEINSERVLLERGNYVFIPMGSSHQSFYEFGSTRLFNVGISKRFFDTHYQPLIPGALVASQVYSIKDSFLNYIESVIASLHFRENDFNEFIELVSFYIINHLRHQKEDATQDEIPSWLKTTIESMHDKNKFGEDALSNMISLSGKCQEYLTRSTQRHYNKTPMQIINDIRIDFAKKQLEVTDSSITDIAYESGYSSASIFIKKFKQSTAFTPSHYRKNLMIIQ